MTLIDAQIVWAAGDHRLVVGLEQAPPHYVMLIVERLQYDTLGDESWTEVDSDTPAYRAVIVRAYIGALVAGFASIDSPQLLKKLEDIVIASEKSSDESVTLADMTFVSESAGDVFVRVADEMQEAGMFDEWMRLYTSYVVSGVTPADAATMAAEVVVAVEDADSEDNGGSTEVH